jgi:hypothetical protein
MRRRYKFVMVGERTHQQEAIVTSMPSLTLALGFGRRGRCKGMKQALCTLNFALIFGQTFPDGSLQFVVGDKEFVDGLGVIDLGAN